MTVKYIALTDQYNSLEKEIDCAVKRVLSGGNYILGNEGRVFESTIAPYCDSSFAFGVANGTDALILSLKALKVGKGDEVITAPNSFLATAGAIFAAGAKPVFVDVREDYNINPDLIEEAITPRTKAIMPVHLTGRPADMAPIMEIAKRHDLAVVEDAAQAIGATYSGKKVGSFGEIGCFSLHPLKTLNASGDGGFITTSNLYLYEKIPLLRNHGLVTRDEAVIFGHNSRLDELQAAILNVKLKHLDDWNVRRREIADFYSKSLSDLVYTPSDKPNEKAVYHTFVIQADRRDDLQTHLGALGIETKIHYSIPIHLQPAAKDLGYNKGDFPVAERQASRILSLPVHQYLTDDEVEEVVKGVKSFYK